MGVVTSAKAFLMLRHFSRSLSSCCLFFRVSIYTSLKNFSPVQFAKTKIVDVIPNSIPSQMHGVDECANPVSLCLALGLFEPLQELRKQKKYVLIPMQMNYCLQRETIE